MTAFSPKLSPISVLALVLTAGLTFAACGTNKDSTFTQENGPGGNGDGGDIMVGPGVDGGTKGGGGDPTTCDQAAASKTYIGCDFWPTVLVNPVWSVFDYAVVVANAGTAAANVTVSRSGYAGQTVQVAPNSLQTIYLPWVTALKGGDTSSCGNGLPSPPSAVVAGGAYHLVSSVPVTVYQFNALEYQGKGGPAGKDWSSCPGNDFCVSALGPIGCFSFSNDASLLLPSTAMTGNYRVTAAGTGSYFGVTGTADNTSVTVYVAPGGAVSAGGKIASTAGGGKLTFTVNAGDVAEVIGGTGDLTGSLVQASSPVQVISGVPCLNEPDQAPACDHVEESVFPAETLGQHYFVTVPTSPHGNVVGHVVRIVGNVDGTTLTYPSGSKPAKAPTTLKAGQVVDLGVVSADFEVQGNHEFAVVNFMLGGSLQDPNTEAPNQLGDPSESNATAVEQYRLKYIFLSPVDYTVSFVDIVEPSGATVTLDGKAVNVAPVAIGTKSGFGIARVPLTAGSNGGAHVLTASAPVGIQVVGYGAYTSYQYPGGLNLDAIAPAPTPPN